jgi:hypothetical protein
MAKKTKVSFVAKKTISKPVKVRFETRDGLVSFKAKKKISKPVRVSFFVEKKKRDR